MNTPVRGVLVDLDDTLYPQAEFLDFAWRAVAECGGQLGLDRAGLLVALRAVAAAGSDRGEIIDRALISIGDTTFPVAPLLTAFRAACPPRLTPYPGALQALAELRCRVPIALITDGEVTGQQRKMTALGLDDAFDVIVFSDHWGRDHRKPHTRPFHAALNRLNVAGEHAVMIGDRPDKDVAGAAKAQMRAIRVGTGEYSARPDHPATWFRADTFADAVRHLQPYLADSYAGAEPP